MEVLTAASTASSLALMASESIKGFDTLLEELDYFVSQIPAHLPHWHWILR